VMGNRNEMLEGIELKDSCHSKYNSQDSRVNYYVKGMENLIKNCLEEQDRLIECCLV